MDYQKSVRELLKEHYVRVENKPFVCVIKLENLTFIREIGKRYDYLDSSDELFYIVSPAARRSKVQLSIFKKTQLLDDSKTLAIDTGDPRSMSMRNRVLRAVKKQDWQAAKTVECDLERLASLVPYYWAEREKLLLESIEKGEDRTLKVRLTQARQESRFPTKTLQLLDALDGLPPTASDDEPSQASFTLRQVSGKTGWTIDAVRHRFSPLEGQPFIEVVRQGRGNQPTVYRYLPEKRPIGTRAQYQATITSDTEIVKPPKVAISTQRESKGLLCYGEKPNEGSY